ncbi:PREDICTED: LOW QUALITY PROTEIN: uncharacterized protein LOC106749616 [Dinoponera quadriceps]|uniref:LOW QUALITY PROTEIN: uncharacterized protein LOC106749616 n=1 Tax=Dinoponera quadriceps TaxID=609295 RepID=A0A6P3Y1Q7_DINQU|nr:PREDICTED: LOW QUALITY PROTEIN: uncharacterized protein LOC106749616 [Dinoponera quadriceps]
MSTLSNQISITSLLRYMMDLAANGLEKTSAKVRREAMISKLQNMQWLKNTSHPASILKTHCKPRRGHEEDNKVEGKIPAMEDSNANSAEETREYYLTVNIHMRDLSSDSMAKSDRNLQDKNMNKSNIFPNAHVSVMQKAEEEESSMAIQENLATVQLENQCHVDKERKDQGNMSQNALEDKTQNVTCSKFPESQDHDAKELDLTNDSGKNNNAKLTTLDVSKAITSESSGNDKASVEPKDKDACMKKTLTSLRTNIKNASTTSLSKCCNDKPSTLFTNSKRSFSNLSKSPITDKSGRGERASGKRVFRKKTCPKDEFVRQHGATKGMENKTKDTAAGLPKADEKVPNKTADTSQNDQKAQSSSCPASSNKDKISQVQQRITTRQFTPKSKGQKSSRGNASIDRGVDKNKAPDRTEKAVPACRNSDSPKRERRSGEKNPPSDPKPYVATRNTTFVAPYKNSTLWRRPAKTKSVAPVCGRNPLYARRSNATPERAGTVGKMNRDCPPVDVSPSLDTRAEEPSNFESDVKQQRERDGYEPAKSPDASILNIDDNGNSTGDKKPAASVEDHARHVASGESCPNEKALDRTDPTDVDDEGMKPSKDSLTKSYAGSPMSQQHIYKPEDTQQQTQMRSRPVIWNKPSEERDERAAILRAAVSADERHAAAAEHLRPRGAAIDRRRRHHVRRDKRQWRESSQRPFTPGQPASQIGRWNFPVQDGFHTVPPNVADQSNSYNDQLPANVRTNPSYVKGMYEPGNTDDARSNRYYNKRYNCPRTTAYDVPQYATPHPPVSPAQQQSFAAMNQYNVFGGQRYYKQNAMNYAQSRPKKTQDREDGSLEDALPIILPKEFMTNSVNIPNKTDQLPPRMFMQDLRMRFRMRQNTGYRQSPFQSGGFRENVPCDDFPKEYHASFVGRRIVKTIQIT